MVSLSSAMKINGSKGCSKSVEALSGELSSIATCSSNFCCLFPFCSNVVSPNATYLVSNQSDQGQQKSKNLKALLQ